MPRLPLVFPARRLAAPLAAMLALAACHSSPQPVQFDPNPVTKYRWRGELAPVASVVDAGSTDAPVAAPTAATGRGATARTASAGTVERTGASVTAASVAGSAVVQPGTGETETIAFLTLRGAPPGSWWRWRVVEGDCASGTIAGPASAYQPALVGVDGFAESVAMLPIPAPRDAQWAVQVMRGDGAAPVACAPLRLSR